MRALWPAAVLMSLLPVRALGTVYRVFSGAGPKKDVATVEMNAITRSISRL